MNLPNSITLTRIASVPLLVWALSPKFPVHGAHGEQEIIASAIFIVASITDGVDGYLARRRGQITTLGILLDPLADKLMVSTAFICLIAYNPAVVAPWMAVLVIGGVPAAVGWFGVPAWSLRMGRWLRVTDGGDPARP